MAELRATPYANPLTGLTNDAIQGLLAFMQDKRRTQQLQGLGNLLESTGIPKTVERAAYADSPRGLLDALTNVNRANVPFLKPETAEAAMTLAPIAAPVNRALMQATKGLPVGASIKNVGTKLKVKPPTDDVYEVMDATFEYAKLGGNKTLPIDQLTGGVRMTDPKEVKRVKDLAEKISSPDGYVSRIIVDDLGNVLEGQHRLEALRLLGEKNVPVAVIQDLSNKYDIPAMKKALEGKFRSDETRQLLKHSIDTLEEAGSIDKALSDFAMPARYQKPFEDAIKASKVKSSYPQQEALDTAQRNAALPIEEGGLGLPKDNTPEMRAEAMGFDLSNPQYHATDAYEDFTSIRPSARGKMGAGIYTSPEASYAEKYGGNKNKRILPMVSRGEYADADNRENIFDMVRGELYQKNPNFTSQELNNAVSQEMQRKGYSGFDVDKERVTFIPDEIRSRFAAFDPFRMNTETASARGVAPPDLLAGVLPLGLLTDEDQRKKLYEMLPSLLGQ